ncbi:MAG: hypothetical protein ACFHWX_17340 [Bacteroidota bacterium]
MIKNPEQYKIIERYERMFTLGNDQVYKIDWKSRVLSYLTCGKETHEIECLETIPESITISEIVNGSEVEILQVMFKARHPEEMLDFACNCHGFTFAHGKFTIDNYFVPVILDAEFEEVSDVYEIKSGDFDIVCFKDIETSEWIHSVKFQYELYIHKEGLRKFSVHRNLEDILHIPEYIHSEAHYFRRSNRMCSGICLNAIGEEYIKTFANEC